MDCALFWPAPIGFRQYGAAARFSLARAPGPSLAQYACRSSLSHTAPLRLHGVRKVKCGINHCLVKNVSTKFDIFISDEFSNIKKRYNLIISTCKVSKKTPWACQLTLAETEFSNVAHESRKGLIIVSPPQIGRKRTRGSLFRA